MSKVIDERAGDRWARFRDRSGMVMRDVGGNVLLVGRDMMEPVRISESSISGELEDLSTPEAHAQLRAWGYEVRGDDVPTGRLASPTIEPPLTESRVREIVEEVLAAKAKPTPSEIDEAVRIANDPATECRNVTTMVVGPGFCGLVEDVPPEPDWRGLLDAVVNAPSFTAHGIAIKKAVEALASARTNLASKGGK